MIIEALVKTKGRRNKAADMLGWGRSTLWRKIKQYKVDA
jgi:two-component system response regulator AtoC